MVAVMAVGTPVALLEVKLHIATGKTDTLHVEERVTEVGACGGAGAAGIDDSQASPMLGLEHPCPGGPVAPQAGQGLLGKASQLPRTPRFTLSLRHSQEYTR